MGFKPCGRYNLIVKPFSFLAPQEKIYLPLFFVLQFQVFCRYSGKTAVPGKSFIVNRWGILTKHRIRLRLNR